MGWIEDMRIGEHSKGLYSMHLAPFNARNTCSVNVAFPDGYTVPEVYTDGPSQLLIAQCIQRVLFCRFSSKFCSVKSKCKNFNWF